MKNLFYYPRYGVLNFTIISLGAHIFFILHTESRKIPCYVLNTYPLKIGTSAASWTSAIYSFGLLVAVSGIRTLYQIFRYALWLNGIFCTRFPAYKIQWKILGGHAIWKPVEQTLSNELNPADFRCSTINYVCIAFGNC